MITGGIVGDGIVGAAGRLHRRGRTSDQRQVAAPASGVLGFGLVSAGLANVVPVLSSMAGRKGHRPRLGRFAATSGYAVCSSDGSSLALSLLPLARAPRWPSWRAARFLRLGLRRQMREASHAGGEGAPLIKNPLRVRKVERKCRNGDLKTPSVRVDHPILTHHEPARRGQGAARGVFE